MVAAEGTLLLEPGVEFSWKLPFGGARVDVAIRPAGPIARVVGTWQARGARGEPS